MLLRLVLERVFRAPFAGISLPESMVAPMVLDGPINGDWFEACVTKVLVPELRPR